MKEDIAKRAKQAEETDPAFESLLEFLKDSRGFDFTGYKRASLRRRMDKRMQEIGIASYPQYLDELQVRPDEFTDLFNFILINVTAFFRDPQVWTYLASAIIPDIIGRHAPDDPIRVWSAGCASGEEAYSIAMLFADALGDKAFKSRVKIYGTDVDEDALAQARLGIYGAKAIDGVPAPMRSKFFERFQGSYAFKKDLRRSLIFGRHDIVQDPPISRIDLILCRNTLMYLNADTQTQVMTRLNYALNQGGYLVLGKSEMPFTRMKSFVPVDLKRRVFAKEGEEAPMPAALGQGHGGEAAGHLANYIRSRDAAFESATVPQLVVDRSRYLVLANDRARQLCGITPSDIGRPFQDLEISYRPIDLRTPMDEVLQKRHPLTAGDATFAPANGNPVDVAVDLAPLFDPSGTMLGVSISLTDVTQRKRLQVELEHSNQELETALEELQSTNEELETTNEELQSTNEELETTNEELQSTNEELETMNEELQATNEELQTVNMEARQTTTELDRLNTFFGSILMSLNAGVAVLDTHDNVLVWNRKAEDLWGLRSDEVVGMSFFDLDIGLPQKELSNAVHAVLDGSEAQVVELDAVNRRGRTITCRVEVTRLRQAGPDNDGVIIVMEPRDGNDAD